MDEYLKTATILYVEDDEMVRDSFIRPLQRYAKELFVAVDGEDGLAQFKKYSPDIVISDINMPRKNGLEMVKDIREIKSEQNILFTTAYSDSDILLKALELQVNGYFLKPVEKDKLVKKISTISKNIYLEKEHQKQNKILQQILNNQSTIVLLTDFETISFASHSFYECFNLKKLEEFFVTYKSISDMFLCAHGYLYASTAEVFLDKYNKSDDLEHIVLIKDIHDKNRTFRIAIDSIDDSNLFIIDLTDITELQNKQLEVETKAYYDTLTGIYNREKFNEIFAYELHQTHRYGAPLSIAILDIDHFKEFNDKFGHLIGDEVLIMMAKEVSSHVRESDTFARWGGEEFMLIMTNTKIEDAIHICNHLRDVIQNIIHEIAGSITVSFGVTQIVDTDTLKTSFKRSDDALYEAKNSGRNRVEFK
ncbi:MAG: diguanylate cyclase [Helicobacteraceae bacterium]|nr:diguanylate cyclase [Helicobacteraceae bacterium]